MSTGIEMQRLSSGAAGGSSAPDFNRSPENTRGSQVQVHRQEATLAAHSSLGPISGADFDQ